jgi:hypothetical protein
VYMQFLSAPLPTTSISTAERRERRNGPDRFSAMMSSGKARFCAAPPQPTSLPLLLTNCQIHDELKSTITRMKKADALFYELDCEVVDEHTIFPTWLLLPIYMTHIPVIYTTFRISGTLPPNTSRSGWGMGCGGPSYMIWSLLEIISLFLCRGPHFCSSLETWKGTVDTLILNVLTPTLEPGQVFRIGNNVRTPGAVMHPKIISGNLRSWLTLIFSRDKRSMVFGKPVAARIKRIQLLEDGVEAKVWDLENMKHLH